MQRHPISLKARRNRGINGGEACKSLDQQRINNVFSALINTRCCRMISFVLYSNRVTSLNFLQARSNHYKSSQVIYLKSLQKKEKKNIVRVRMNFLFISNNWFLSIFVIDFNSYINQTCSLKLFFNLLQISSDIIILDSNTKFYIEFSICFK